MTTKTNIKDNGRGLGSVLLGILLFCIGLMWFEMVLHMVNLWLHREHYIEAELEVVKYHYVEPAPSRNSSSVSDSPNQIEGIIHPGDEKIWTNDRDVSVSVFASPTSVVGRHPTKAEIEGKRIKVLHWPPHDPSWWQPPATLSGFIPYPSEVLLHASIVVGLILRGVYLFRRGVRLALNKEPSPSGPGHWPPWTGGVLVLTIILWLLFTLLCSIVLPGEKLNPTGTERIPRTTQEWLIGGGFLIALGIVCLAATGMCLRQQAKDCPNSGNQARHRKDTNQWCWMCKLPEEETVISFSTNESSVG